MLRFLVGFGLGSVLALCSFGFIGVGHGSYVPMVFSGSLIALITTFGAVVPLVLVPLLWGLYFLFIPRIPKKPARLAVALIVIVLHLATGIWLTIQDPAFTRALNSQRGLLLSFVIVLAGTMGALLYSAVLGRNQERLYQ